MINIDNRIGYSGVVTLKKYSTKKKKVISTQVIKNRGTVDLFKFLCSCLIQQYSANEAPRYLGASNNMIAYQNQNKNISTMLTNITSAIAYKSKISNTELIQRDAESPVSGKSWHAVFYGTILFGQLLDANNSIKSIQLYAEQSMQDISSPLAYINLNENGIQLKNGEALLVEWDMSFNNWNLQSTDQT